MSSSALSTFECLEYDQGSTVHVNTVSRTRYNSCKHKQQIQQALCK